MRNLKKFLALVLSMMMVLSLFVTASATSIKSSIDSKGDAQVFTDAKDREFQVAIDVLNGMDVLKGYTNTDGTPNGEFGPEKYITRAEVAALVFRLTTGQTKSDAADHYARYGNFSDVRKDAWYAGYVGYCANAGYIKGYDPGEGGRFGPSDNVTGYQALAMILRAMGYGVNGEFEGGNWQLNVSSIGTQTEILAGITNSHFGNETLYGYAPREVVAEIYFQAIQTPCVVYTPAFGYQTTDVYASMGNDKTDNGLTANATLGERYFGLTETDRVIVANQATGEFSTLLGAKWSVGGAAVYAYPDSALTWDDDGNVKDKMDSGLNLNVKTDLDMFGHRVTAYYDARGGGAHRTYALYDNATTKYVYAKDGDLSDDLGTQAKSAGFAVDLSKGFHVSDRYGWISNSTTQTAAKFAPINISDHADGNDTDEQVLYGADADSTVKVKEDTTGYDKDDEDAVLPYGSEAAAADNSAQRYDTVKGARGYETGSYYRLISNGTGKVDVVITVAPELERVTEWDTTAGTNTVRLSGLSDVQLTDRDRNDSTFGEKDNGYVRVNSLVDGSKKDIGSLVVGWEVKGTNYSVDYLKNVNKDESKLYTYYLQPTVEKITGTVERYQADTGEVVVNTGSGTRTLHFTLLPIINYAVSPSWDTHDNSFYFYNGTTYEFTIDPTDSSRYVAWNQGNDYEFLYATYADHKDGGLGTADLGYYVTGVNWNGEIVENAQFTTVDKSSVTGASYESLMIAKKNLGGATYYGWDAGNEIQSGYYTGYAYNAGTKDLDTTYAGWASGRSDSTLYNWEDIDGALRYSRNNKFWANKIHALYDGAIDGQGNDIDGVWRVDRDDVADGWAEQPTNAGLPGGLLLTPNTKFIAVSGTGIGESNKLSVKIYNGISELLGTSRNVTINVKRTTTVNGVVCNLPEYNAYYKLADEQFNNWYKESQHLAYTDDNWMVDTVILPASCIKWSDNTNLWFTNVTAPTGYYLPDVHADTDTIEEYTMYKDGVKQNVFIDWSMSTDMNGAPWSTANGINADNCGTHGRQIGTFYELTEVYKKGNTPIYAASAMKATNNGGAECDNIYRTLNSKTICNIDLKYDYTAVNNLNTARLTARGRNTEVFTADAITGDPLSNVYNVTGAPVYNLTSYSNIKDIKSLNEAVSVGYRVTVAIVNDGHTVTQIYVTEVNAPNTWDPTNPLV